MLQPHLLTEGDINLSENRKNWYTKLSSETLEWLERDAAVFLHQSLSSPCLDILESCEGIYLINAEGKKYMDFHGNNVHQVGYRNPYVIRKLKEQLDLLPFSPRRYTNRPAIEMSEKLVSYFPGDLKRVLFCPGGTGAVGMALKLARVITGKTKVVSWADSFHGASLDAIAAGGEEQFKKYMGAFPETINIPQPKFSRQDIESGIDVQFADQLENILQSDPHIGAFIAETIRNTDVVIPSKAYWQRIREICTRHGILLILDEIPIAFGKTGRLFAFEHYGIEPDIVCLGKGLGAGIIPMAGIVTRERYNIVPEISLGHYTYEKNPLGSTAALAMLEFIEQEGILEKVRKDEVFVREQLNELQTRHACIGEVRGIGLLWGVELVKDRQSMEKDSALADRVMYHSLRKGLSFKVSSGNVLQLAPSLIINREELMEAIRIIDEAIEEEWKM